MNFTLTRETPIKILPNSIKNQLIDLLDNDSAWLKIMSIVTKDPYDPNELRPKYSCTDIQTLETCCSQLKTRCSLKFLYEWQSTGRRKRPNLEVLLKLSIQAQVFQVADFIAMNLLNEPPPERPSTGVAARINTDIDSEEVSLKNETENTLLFNLNTPDKEEPKNCTLGPLENFRFTNSSIIENEEIITPLVYDFETVNQLSGNFKTLLRRGGFGKVFLGNMPNGKAIVIKKLIFSEIDEKHVKEELTILKKCNHPNLLLLRGYCYHRESCYLIHDFISNGSLEDALKKSSSLSLVSFNRLNIAYGTIKALNYLHTFFEEPYVHRDVKSANILIERDLTPKLCDFEGLRKISSDSEQFTETIFGTEAYMAPEANSGDISIKMDSYSFGVVILELLTGLSAYDDEREESYLVGFLDEVKIENITPFLDLRAEWTGHLPKSLFELAKKCLEIEKDDRLDSGVILKELEKMIN